MRGMLDQRLQAAARPRILDPGLANASNPCKQWLKRTYNAFTSKPPNNALLESVIYSVRGIERTLTTKTENPDCLFSET